MNFTYNTWILLGLFAVSLNSIGISYKVGYSVAIALRYIPDIQRDYHSISQAQQARGVELGINEHFFARLKNSVNILLPLILTSLNRIDTISNAMELRGFGKDKKRTWYTRRPFARRDFIVLGIGVLEDFIIHLFDKRVLFLKMASDLSGDGFGAFLIVNGWGK